MTNHVRTYQRSRNTHCAGSNEEVEDVAQIGSSRPLERCASAQTCKSVVFLRLNGCVRSSGVMHRELADFEADATTEALLAPQTVQVTSRSAASGFASPRAAYVRT